MLFEQGSAFRFGIPFYTMAMIFTEKGVSGICRHPAGEPRGTTLSLREW
jgi:hypothetical protein